MIVAAGILKMSQKYMAHDIRSKAYVYLQHQFPAQCNLFLERYEAGTYASFTTESLVRVANAARETNTLVILPAILFLLCTRPMDDILKYTFTDPTSDESILSPVNFVAVLKGRPRISLFARKNIYSFAFLNKEVTGCQTNSDCRSLNSLWAETAEQMEGWIDPFERPPDRHGLRLIRNARCSVCRAKATDEMREGRMKMWNRIPDLFDLPNWDEMARLSQTLDDI